MKFKDFLKLGIFFGFLFVLVELLSFIIMPAKKVFKYGFYDIEKHEILLEEPNTIDVIALGDSLIYSSISPMEIWKDYGYTVFDVSESAQITKETIESLKIAIDTQHPKIVILDSGVLFRDPSKTPRQKPIRKIKRELKHILPSITKHDNWKKISIFSGYNKINPTKGYKFVVDTKSGNNAKYMKYTKNERQILPDNIEKFEYIIDLCEENNIKLFLVAMPTKKGWTYQKHNTIDKLSKKYKLQFTDFNIDNIANIDWEKDTWDRGQHLNYLGARKVSKYLGEFLYKTKMLTDHRKDKNYKSWSDAFEQYQEYSETQILRSKYNYN